MDEADFNIVRAIMADPFGGAAPAARATGMTAQTVRNRLARMAAGPAQGFRALPAACVLGMEGYAVLAADARLEDVTALPGAYWAVEYDDGTAAALVYGHEPPDMDVVLRQRLTPRPPRERPLARTEWRILPHLIHDARAPLSAIADATGLAPKTVAKYRRRLWEDGLVSVVLHVNEAEVPGALWHHVFTLGAPPRRLHGIPLAWTDPPGAVMVLHADSARQRIEQTRTIADENPGAQVASRIGVRHAFLGDRIEAMVGEAAGHRGVAWSPGLPPS